MSPFGLQFVLPSACGSRRGSNHALIVTQTPALGSKCFPPLQVGLFAIWGGLERIPHGRFVELLYLFSLHLDIRDQTGIRQELKTLPCPYKTNVGISISQIPSPSVFSFAMSWGICRGWILERWPVCVLSLCSFLYLIMPGTA